jgi:hypothetical protein
MQRNHEAWHQCLILASGFHVLILVEWILVPWLTPLAVLTFIQIAFTKILLHSRASCLFISPSTSTPGGVSSSPRLDFSQGP